MKHITNFKLFESKDDKIEELYKEYKKAETKEEKDKMVRKIAREAVNSGNMKPWFEKVAQEMNEQDGTKLYTFNIEADKDFAVNELGIRSIPTIKGFSGGKEVYHSTGVLREEQIKTVASQIL
jgi:thioredoxin-like negative regulator of GroEL